MHPASWAWFLLQGWKVVLDRQLVHEALAVVLCFRSSVHQVPELEASRMFVPQFCQLQPQQDVILSPIGNEQLAHGVFVQVPCDGMDQLQHPSHACSSHNHANRRHHLDVRVGFLVWTDGKLSFALVD